MTALALVLTAACLAQAATATLSGRVVDDRGTPVSGAYIVAVGGPEVPGARSVIATEDGRFAIRDLDPGLYTISAGRSGFPSINHGQTRPGGRGKPIDIKAGQQLVLPLTLPRGGVVSGTVLDQLGNPARGGVSIRLETAPGTRPPFTPYSSTDSRGRFRAFGLAAGTYRISGAPLVAGADDPPGTTTVTIAPGEERDGIVVRTPPPQPQTYVTVSASSSDGSPVRSFQLTVRKPGETRQVYSSNRPNADGSRTLTDMFAGQYRIIARNGPYIGAADVSVDGEHPGSVAITMTRGVNVRGTVSTSEGPLPPNRLSLGLYPADADSLFDDNNGSFGQAGPDGTFSIPGVPPGRYVLRGLFDDRLGWALDSAKLGDVDIVDQPLTVGRDEITGVAVTLTKQKTRLTGNVTDASGSPMNGVDVVAFPADPQLRVRNSRRVRVSRTTIAGEYDLQGLPPGRYALAIVEDVDQQAIREPDALNRLKPVTTVTLTAGEQRASSVVWR